MLKHISKVFILFILLFKIPYSHAQTLEWACSIKSVSKGIEDHRKSIALFNKNLYVLLGDSFETYGKGTNEKGLVCFDPAGNIKSRSKKGIYSPQPYEIVALKENPGKGISILTRFSDSARIGNLHFNYLINSYTDKYVLINADKDCNFINYKVLFEGNNGGNQVIDFDIDNTNHYFFYINKTSDLWVENWGAFKSTDSASYVFEFDSSYKVLNKTEIGKYNLKSYRSTIFIDSKNDAWTIASDKKQDEKIVYLSSGKILTEYHFTKFNFDFNEFYCGENYIWLLGSFSNNGHIFLNGTRVGGNGNQLLVKFDKKKLKVAWYGLTDSVNNWGLIHALAVDVYGNAILTYYTYNFNSGDGNYLKINNDTIVRSKKMIGTISEYLFTIDTSNRVAFNRVMYNGNYGFSESSVVPWSNLFTDECGNIYYYSLVHDCGTSRCMANQDSVYLGLKTYMFQGNSTNYILARFTSDNLDFHAEYDCNGIILINKSSSKYKSFEWKFDSLHSTTVNWKLFPRGSDSIRVYLTGLKDNGCINTIYKDIAPPLKESIHAEFKTSEYKGCQWIGIKFDNLSYTDSTNGPAMLKWKWDFGDGTFDTTQNPVHVYTRSGVYNVVLNASNGFCSDTFKLHNEIIIQPAPRPGFSVKSSSFCAPAKIVISDTSKGSIQQAWYYVNDSLVSNDPDWSINLPHPGKYMIKQVLLGPSGCVTSDSIELEIQPSVTPLAFRIYSISVCSENLICLSWSSAKGSKNFEVQRSADGNSFTSAGVTEDTFFIDHITTNLHAWIYRIRAYDQCGDRIETIGKSSIYLDASKHTNTSRVLYWNSDNSTENKSYFLERSYDTILNSVVSTHDTLYKDFDALMSPSDSVRYRVKLNYEDFPASAYSNIIKLLYLPSLFVPNSFTPDNDDINDSFIVRSSGIKEMRIDIYDRWGNRIYSSSNPYVPWDGAFKGMKCPEGVYIYVIVAQGYDGKWISKKGSITLLH
jgi:gliding motility-associated-like protein